MRRSDTLLLAHLDEIEALIDSGAMAEMTEAEEDALGKVLRDVVAELPDLGSNAADSRR